MRENRETSQVPIPNGGMGRSGKGNPHNPDMYAWEESDIGVVPTNLSNKEPLGSAEIGEGRPVTLRNSNQDSSTRTQSRSKSENGLERVRQMARKDKRMRFTALLHHVSLHSLQESFHSLKRNVAPGVDGITWSEYGQNLLERLKDLHGRIHKGSYRPQPSKRVYIPKADGRERPLGIAALEDKIVQSALVKILNGIYEEDFLGFSYGFRPGRSAHGALDALWVGIMRKKVNHVLDADIRGFFDTVNHEWLMKFLQHRIADTRVLSLIGKFLRAGTLEKGKWESTNVGTPQGAVLSPLLANVYLHYVLDLWVQKWRKTKTSGVVIISRYCDDFVLGFQHRVDAEQFLEELRMRMRTFGLELHPEKTRLILFGRFAAQRCQERAKGKPETFNFLGFTHMCSKSQEGKFMVLRKTMAKRLGAKLKDIRQVLLRRRHEPIPLQGQWIKRVVQGYLNYHSVPGNNQRMDTFCTQVARIWLAALRRRSQRHKLPWDKFNSILREYLPKPRILHPWPNVRFDAKYSR